jgi:tRNA modification GTPase
VFDADTIAAIATAPGQGGIGIVRVSGADALRIGHTLCQSDLTPRFAHYLAFRDSSGETLDTGIALYFPAPHSFTGEDVLELQGHGGPMVLELLLTECCRIGARIAEPGEFSQRAFLNDKIDLAQAEAIADLVSATTEAGVRSANQSLQGVFSAEITALIEQVVALRVYVEAAIDFPEEEIDFIADSDVVKRIESLSQQLTAVVRVAKQGKLLRDGMKLVIAGRPNAGKSSLLNALSGEETAIVTPIEGTTRDLLREHIQIDGMPLHVVDTAGLRNTTDLAEREGISRAWREMETADHILLVADDSHPEERAASTDVLWPELRRRIPRCMPVTIIHNKCDLTGRNPGIEKSDDATIITLSAQTRAGLDLLRSHLKSAMGFQPESGHGFMARRRHLDALERAHAALADGLTQIQQHGAAELLAEDLRRCHDRLGEITGSLSADEMLGEIFSSFCIGK